MIFEARSFSSFHLTLITDIHLIKMVCNIFYNSKNAKRDSNFTNISFNIPSHAASEKFMGVQLRCQSTVFIVFNIQIHYSNN